MAFRLEDLELLVAVCAHDRLRTEQLRTHPRLGLGTAARITSRHPGSSDCWTHYALRGPK